MPFFSLRHCFDAAVGLGFRCRRATAAATLYAIVIMPFIGFQPISLITPRHYADCPAPELRLPKLFSLHSAECRIFAASRHCLVIIFRDWLGFHFPRQSSATIAVRATLLYAIIAIFRYFPV